ncbi:hypothetical protein B0T09DRAFT_374074 [Sordaria sp. MPI-SDFR-AT-0083]|nr:hypothetical protein B0T09DRAFT_374074 [Sordaria sp. MPI-SDFR-AT-0083]
MTYSIIVTRTLPTVQGLGSQGSAEPQRLALASRCPVASGRNTHLGRTLGHWHGLPEPPQRHQAKRANPRTADGAKHHHKATSSSQEQSRPTKQKQSARAKAGARRKEENG